MTVFLRKEKKKEESLHCKKLKLASKDSRTHTEMPEPIPQVVLFCNELGSKFSEITNNDYPLPFLPVANRPLITYHLELLNVLQVNSKNIHTHSHSQHF